MQQERIRRWDAQLPDTKITIKGKTIEKVMAQHLGIEKGTHSNIHNLTPDTLRQLPKQINEPVAVFKSGNDATRQGYVVLTELTEKDTNSGKDKPVIVALHLNKTKQGVELINVASIYGKDSLSALQKSLDSDLLYWNKEKGQNFVNAFSLQLPSQIQAQSASQTKGSPSNVGSLRLQPETHSAVSLSTTNIKTNEDLVKYQSVNSPAFKRWFGDSKVVDSDGKPLVMYHGTHKAFNSFNTQDFGALLGKGSYFAAERTGAAPYAQQANGKIVEAYLSIQNPYYAKSVLESIPKRNELAEKGFDGVILLNEDGSVKWAVAHEPSQIKSATKNTGDFDPSNADIRFSRRHTDFEGIPQSPAQAKAWAKQRLKEDFIQGYPLRRSSEFIRYHMATPLHLSLTEKEFKPVFELIQERMNHVAAESSHAMEKAPELLGRRENLKDFGLEAKNAVSKVGGALGIGNNKYQTDMEAAGKALFDGTRIDEKVYSDDELTREGLTPDQIQRYREMRAAIDTSLEQAAKTHMSIVAKVEDIFLSNQIHRLHDLDLPINQHRTELEETLKAVRQALDPKDPLDARTIKRIDKALSQIDEIAKKTEHLQATGYAPMMRFGDYVLYVGDKATGETALYEMFETERERNRALESLKQAGISTDKYEIDTSIKNPDEYKMFRDQGINPETLALFGKEAGLDQDATYQAYLKAGHRPT